MHSLVNDSLTKINALMKKAEGKREIVLLAQTANNLLKVQTKIEQLERYMEKTLLKIPVAGIFKGGFLRSYIFTAKELDIIEQYLKTGRRTPAFNKLLHYVRHNHRLLTDMRIYLTLLALSRKRRKEEPLKLPPGRPSKLMSGLKGLK
jgi:hypothetical protein